MRVLDKELQNKTIDINKLISYGFTMEKDGYQYEEYLLDYQFLMIVEYANEKMTSKVIDIDMKEEYLLVDVLSASGEFVGKVRDEYESKLEHIVSKCCITEIYKSEYPKLVIAYVKNTYDGELEFLWTKVSETGVFRHKKDQKWYCAMLKVSAHKLGLDSDEILEVIDLKNTPDEITKLVNHTSYFPGYHMNKKHWFTMKLDGSVPIETIYKLIDVSYQITKK